MARLVEAAIAQLDLIIEDPTVGGMVRADADGAFTGRGLRRHRRPRPPALAAYRDALRTTVLPTARDDEHPGLCYLPDGEAMYRALAVPHVHELLAR